MTERRSDTRRAAGRPHPVHLLSHAGAPLGTATILDVSATGVRVTTSCPCAAGGLVVLAPQRPHPLAGQRLSLRVTRCEVIPAGGYRVAGVFLRPLADVEVQGLAGA